MNEFDNDLHAGEIAERVAFTFAIQDAVRADLRSGKDGIQE